MAHGKHCECYLRLSNAPGFDRRMGCLLKHGDGCRRGSELTTVHDSDIGEVRRRAIVNQLKVYKSNKVGTQA